MPFRIFVLGALDSIINVNINIQQHIDNKKLNLYRSQIRKTGFCRKGL